MPMAIDLTTERIISAKEAAKLVPGRDGGPSHVSKIIRALTRGSPGPGGERILLEGFRLCGGWVTSVEALERYAERLTPVNQAAPAGRTPVARRRALERADAELDKLGV
jgi:hypothetical protein